MFRLKCQEVHCLLTRRLKYRLGTRAGSGHRIGRRPTAALDIRRRQLLGSLHTSRTVLRKQSSLLAHLTFWPGIRICTSCCFSAGNAAPASISAFSMIMTLREGLARHPGDGERKEGTVLTVLVPCVRAYIGPEPALSSIARSYCDHRLGSAKWLRHSPTNVRTVCPTHCAGWLLCRTMSSTLRPEEACVD